MDDATTAATIGLVGVVIAALVTPRVFVNPTVRLRESIDAEAQLLHRMPPGEAKHQLEVRLERMARVWLWEAERRESRGGQLGGLAKFCAIMGMVVAVVYFGSAVLLVTVLDEISPAAWLTVAGAYIFLIFEGLAAISYLISVFDLWRYGKEHPRPPVWPD